MGSRRRRLGLHDRVRRWNGRCRCAGCARLTVAGPGSLLGALRICLWPSARASSPTPSAAGRRPRHPRSARRHGSRRCGVVRARRVAGPAGSRGPARCPRLRAADGAPLIALGQTVAEYPVSPSSGATSVMTSSRSAELMRLLKLAVDFAWARVNPASNWSARWGTRDLHRDLGTRTRSVRHDVFVTQHRHPCRVEFRDCRAGRCDVPAPGPAAAPGLGHLLELPRAVRLDPEACIAAEGVPGVVTLCDALTQPTAFQQRRGDIAAIAQDMDEVRVGKRGCQSGIRKLDSGVCSTARFRAAIARRWFRTRMRRARSTTSGDRDCCASVYSSGTAAFHGLTSPRSAKPATDPRTPAVNVVPLRGQPTMKTPRRSTRPNIPRGCRP